LDNYLPLPFNCALRKILKISLANYFELRDNVRRSPGEVAERLKAPVLKTGKG
jgi:hypothetical protein